MTLAKLSADLGARLAARGWRITTAESCTGGMIAAAITHTPGSSGWFDVGYVTYANDAKVRLLRVDPAALAAHGAVSEATARAMAEGALQASGADVAVAVTGVAGPAGGTPDKPVGMVCFAWALRGRATEVATRQLAGDRAAIRRQATCHALARAVALIARAG